MGILEEMQRKRQLLDAQTAANRAQADYDALMPQAQAKMAQAQQGPSNPLEAVLSGIGNSIKNVGTGLMDIFGTGGAAVGDAIESIRTGKATTKNQDDYRKWLYDTDSVKDAAAKGLGTGLDAAATLTDFIPGLGTAAKVGLNIGQGVASGVANPLIEKGASATLDDALKGALVGGASAGVGQAVGGKLANRTAGNSLISKALNSNIGKGAITGGLAGGTGGGLYSALNGGDIIGGAFQGAQGGAMAGGTMAGTMGLIGSGIDRLNRKYNAEPQTPDVPTAKPIVDEVAEQYTKPVTIETALQEAQAPTRRQIGVQYDGSGNGNVAVNRQRNIYRLPDRSGSTLDGILGPNNARRLPNAEVPDYTDRRTAAQVMNEELFNVAGEEPKNYKSLADAVRAGELGGDPKEVMEVLKTALSNGTYDDIDKVIRELKLMDDTVFSGLSNANNKSQLPKIRTSDYIETTGYKGKDIPDYMRQFLSEEKGLPLGDSAWSQYMPKYNNEGQFTGTPDDILDMYENIAKTNARDVYTPERIESALRDSYGLLDDNRGEGFENRVTEEFIKDYRRQAPKRMDIPVNQGGVSMADRLDVTASDRGRLIQDVTPQRRQAQPQVQAQPVQEMPTQAPVAIEYQPTKAANTPEVAETGNMFGRALKNAGNDLQTAQTNITRAERRKFGIPDAGETVNTLRKRTGFSSLDDQADFAKNITGGQNSIMDDILRYNISVDENGKPLTLRTDQYEVAINEAVGKDWKKSVMGESYDQFRKDLISDIQNEDPITASNWLKREAATQRGIAEGKGPTADKAARKAKIYTEVANKIDDLSYSAVPQKNVNRMFDDTIEEFRARANEAKAAGNKKYANAYEKLATELEGTERTIAKYRTFKKDFVKSSQLAEISRGAKSGSLEAGYKRGNVVGRFVNTVLEEPTNRALAYAGGKLSDLGDAINGTSTGAAGKAAGRAGELAGKAAEMLNNDTFSGREISPITRQGQTQTIGDVAMRQLSRQAGLGAGRYQDTQNAIQNATQEAQDVQSNYENSMLQAQQAYNQAQQALSSGSSSLDRIGAAMERALTAGDVNAYSQLASLYQEAAKIYQLQNPSATSSEAKALSANQSKAMAGLQQLQDLRGMQPGVRTALASSPLAGLVDMTGGDDYANQAKSLALTLGYLQSGANITPREAENIGRAYIPSAYDSDQVRQNKLSRAEQLLRNYLADTSSLPQ